MRFDDLAEYPCSITRPLVLFGDRWTLLILKFSFAGVRRYSGFEQALGISKSRLSERLSRLVAAGVLTKQRGENSGVEEYRLTAKGHDVYPILMALRDWGDTYLAPTGPPVHYSHNGCGGEAHIHLECDTCAAQLTARDIRPRPGPGVTA